MKITKKESQIIIKGKKDTVIIQPFAEVKINDKTFDWPGEYQISETSLHLFADNESIASKVTTDEVCFFSPAMQLLKEENDENSDSFDFDVLLLFAETSNFSKKDWKILVEEVEPRIVIFCETGSKTEEVKKELNVNIVETEAEIIIEKSKLPADKSLFIQLS